MHACLTCYTHIYQRKRKPHLHLQPKYTDIMITNTVICANNLNRVTASSTEKPAASFNEALFCCRAWRYLLEAYEIFIWCKTFPFILQPEPRPRQEAASGSSTGEELWGWKEGDGEKSGPCLWVTPAKNEATTYHRDLETVSTFFPEQTMWNSWLITHKWLEVPCGVTAARSRDYPYRVAALQWTRYSHQTLEWGGNEITVTIEYYGLYPRISSWDSH